MNCTICGEAFSLKVGIGEYIINGMIHSFEIWKCPKGHFARRTESLASVYWEHNIDWPDPGWQEQGIDLDFLEGMNALLLKVAFWMQERLEADYYYDRDGFVILREITNCLGNIPDVEEWLQHNWPPERLEK